MVGLTLTAVPLVAAMLPGVITPEPPVNTPVKLELDPDSIVVGLAAKLVIEASPPPPPVEALPDPHAVKLQMPTLANATTTTESKLRFMMASTRETELKLILENLGGSEPGKSELMNPNIERPKNVQF